jgi:hypothetical protein
MGRFRKGARLLVGVALVVLIAFVLVAVSDLLLFLALAGG